MTELSDELLVAYVDGQLALQQTRAVEKVLAQDDVIAARVDALKEAHGRLEGAFETILASEVRELTSYAKPLVERDPRPSVISRAGIAAAVLGIALGAVVALHVLPFIDPDLAVFAPLQLASEQTQATWQEKAGRAHALLSRESLEVGLESQGNPELVTFQLARAIGPAVKRPDLKGEGFGFVRAQLLQHDGKPLGQMLYLAASGGPLALYATAIQGAIEEPRFSREGAIGMVSWSEGEMSYLLAGDRDEASLLHLAEKIRHEPPPAPPLPRRSR